MSRIMFPVFSRNTHPAKRSLLAMLAEGRTISGGAPTPEEELKALSAEDLDAKEAALREEYKTIRESEVPDMARLIEIAGAKDGEGELATLKAEKTRRSEEAAAVAAMDERIKAEDPPAEDPEVEVEVDVTVDPPAEPEIVADPPVETPEAVAASVPRISDIRARNEPAPKAKTAPRVPMSITAGGDLQGISAGSKMEIEQLGEAFASKAHALRQAQHGGRAHVATMTLDYPEDRTLDKDLHSNQEKIDGVIGRDALVAAGGICAPVEASYDLTVVATTDRPVKNALATFGASRGGIRYIAPPTLAGLASGVDVITEAEDQAGGAGGTKPIVTITCGSELQVDLSAVSLRIKVGNFARRTFPEQFDAWYSLGLAQHARKAEGELLRLIAAGSTAVTDGQNFGAARDILEAFGRAATQYRNRHRMSAEATIQALLPAWARDVMVADLTREAPGSAAERLATSYAQVNDFFTARNIAVDWYLDERAGSGQIYGAQAAGPLRSWERTIEGYLFHPGAWLFLDGGELNLGTEIRDSTLNATNDVEAFFETFEAAAFTGVESLQIRGTWCPSGEAANLIDYACPGGS